MRLTIFYFITCCLVLCSSDLFAQVQDSIKKTPKAIFYSIEGELIPNDKLNSVLKSMGSMISMRENKYGDDSIVYRFLKVPEEDLKKHRDAEAQRTVEIKAMVGKPMEDIEIIDIKGKRFRLSKYRGKVVILNFWFTGCPPCIEEIPQLNQLAAKYKKAEVEFLALTFDSLETVNTFLKDHSFKIPIAANARNITNKYHINLFPATLVIDKKGILKYHINSDKDLEALISKEIDEALSATSKAIMPKNK